MKTYYLALKHSSEKIHSVKALNIEEAISYFAERKSLSQNHLLEIYTIHEKK